MDLDAVIAGAVERVLRETLPAMRPQPARLAYTVEEAADELRIGTTLMKKLVRTGAIRSRKIGNRRVIPASAVQEFLMQEDDGCQGEQVPVVEDVFGARDAKTTRGRSSNARTGGRGRLK